MLEFNPFACESGCGFFVDSAQAEFGITLSSVEMNNTSLFRLSDVSSVLIRLSLFFVCCLFFGVFKTLDFIDKVFVKNKYANRINKHTKKDIKKEQWNISQR